MPGNNGNIKGSAGSFNKKASQIRAEEAAREEYKIALSERQYRIDEEINEVIGVFVTVFDEDAPIAEVDESLRFAFYEAIELEALIRFASESCCAGQNPINAVNIITAICRSVIWARKYS